MGSADITDAHAISTEALEMKLNDLRLVRKVKMYRFAVSKRALPNLRETSAEVFAFCKKACVSITSGLVSLAAPRN